MANLQKQMQDEMARFEAEISDKGSTQPTGLPPNSGNFPKPPVKTLPKPPAPPANLSAMIAPSSTLFLPPQLQRAGVKPSLTPSVVSTFQASGSSATTAPTAVGAAVISNKPVLYIPEKDTKVPTAVVKSAPPAKKPKTEAKQPTKTTSQLTSGTAVLKAPSSTVGSAAVKPGQDPKTVKQKKPKKFVRAAGGQVWQDDSLLDWDPNDFRIFCGDLGNDVTDEVLARVFGRFPSFQKAKVVRDKRTNKTKGFGFVSFKDPQDFTRAMKELNGKYVGSRPIKLRKSNWKNRNIDEVRKRQKEKDGLLGKRR